MKLTSGFFAFLLVIWMGGSTYYYVCKIKKDCEKKENHSTIVSEPIAAENEDVIKKDVATKELAEKSKEEKIADLKAKISDGYTVYDFPKNSDKNNNIKSDFIDFAKNLKLYLAENPNEKIEITGYTDNTGSVKTNLFFGKKRALFLKNKFVETGIPEKHFIVKTMGESNPIATNDTETGRNKNRRVVIKLIN